MASKPEQINGDRRLINTNWRRIKQQTSRFRRREARQLLDDAPTRRAYYRGWVA